MRTLRHAAFIRAILIFMIVSLTWLQVGPAWADTARQNSWNRREARLRVEAAQRASGLAPGLTQTPDAALRRKIAAKEKAAVKPTADVRPLSLQEMKQALGRGPLRNPYFNGTLPWQRSLRDVNLCNGNLFKSFTDIQVAPARGAGLVLQRTYNSNDARVGPFGVGWTHAYDIRVQEAKDVQTQSGDPTADGTMNDVPRTDFFGAKHTYHRDADGLYSPPDYLYDEMSSDYGQFLVNGPAQVLDDTDIGMDGTIKHYTNVVTNADDTSGNERACDYIQDRYGNRTTLNYDQSYTQADGSTRKLLTKVTDPTNRSLTFQWTNFGTSSQPAYRITEIDAPTDASTGSYPYRVTYAYYGASDPAAGGAPYQLKSVTLDPDGLNRTTTYTYTSFSGSYYDSSGSVQTGTETGLLASIADPLGHTISYQYGQYYDGEAYNYTQTMSASPSTLTVCRVTEPGSGGSDVWNLLMWGTVSSESDQEADVINNLDATHIQNGSLQPGPANVSGYWQWAMRTLADPSRRMQHINIWRPWFDGAAEYVGYGQFEYEYDSSNNLIFQRTVPGTPQGGEPCVFNWKTYGQHGNVLTDRYAKDDSDYSGDTAGTGNYFPNQTTTTYYNASQYFQQASVTDGSGHVTTTGIGTDTAGNIGDPDTNVGDRGQTLWVQDAGYNDSASPSYHKQYTYTYNQYGQKLTETNLNGVVTQYTYGTSGNDLGNLVQVVQDPGTGHLNRTTVMHYDVMGHVLQSIDAKGQETDFTYNSLGQPLTVKSYNSSHVLQETISYSYGTNGRTQSVSDNRGVTTMAYESGNDRVSSVTDPQTGTISYTYGLDGNRTSMTLPGGGTWTYTYDSALWVLAQDDPDKLTPMLTGITDDQGRTVQIGLSPMGVPESIINDQTFDSNGNRVSYLNATRAFVTAPHTSGYVPGCLEWLGQDATIWYSLNASNQPIHRIISENDYTYDNIGQRLTNTLSAQAANADGSGQVDGNNNPIWQSQRTETYGYDDLSRLASVNYGDGETQTYAFDAMGNRLSKGDTVSGSTTTTYGVDAANRLTTLNGNTSAYTNDADGNTLTGGGRTNVWDSQNRLVSCTVGGVTSTYTYGADGLRRSATVNGVTTYYVYDGTMMVREMKSVSGTLTPAATYLQGPRGPEYRRDDTQAEGTYTDGTGTHPAGKTRWYVYDGLGSVVGEVDPAGNLTATAKYDVYGAKRSGGTGTASSRQGFVGMCGHVTDSETGLVYMQARYYDPSTGRFISQDPGQNGENWFAYTDNNPVNRVDCDGKFWLELAGIIAAAIIAGCIACMIDPKHSAKSFWLGFGSGAAVSLIALCGIPGAAALASAAVGILEGTAGAGAVGGAAGMIFCGLGGYAGAALAAVEGTELAVFGYNVALGIWLGVAEGTVDFYCS